MPQNILRSCGSFNRFNLNFNLILIILGLIACFVVYIVEFLFMLNAQFKFIVIPIQTILFLLLVAAFLKVYLTEPGRVPRFWAMVNDNLSIKKNMQNQRKYCLVCKNFKPQRTHHCSTCGKCILDMDHHCPWVNNCIGFYNRKYFIQFTFYILINLLFVLPQQIYLEVRQLIPIISNMNQDGSSSSSTSIHTAIRLIFILIELSVFFIILSFFLYHLELVLYNETTLMQLKRERDRTNNIQQLDEENLYDLGKYHNFVQVFGKNWWEWLLPIQGTMICDGINWVKRQKQRKWRLNQ